MKPIKTRNIRGHIILIITSVFFSIQLKAQHPFLPQSDVVYKLPAIHPDSLITMQTNNPNLFAYPFIVDIDIVSQGASILRNDTVYYSLVFASPGAYSLNAIFDIAHMHDAGTITLYNPRKTSTTATYTKQQLRNRFFASPLIWDDTLCITYAEPLTVMQQSSIIIHQIAHDFKQNFGEKSQLKAEALPCNINVNCPEGTLWYNEKRAVCKLIIGGTSICTGTVLNTTANDETPYVLTANHCLSTQTSAEKTVFYFNYEYPNCDGTGIVTTNQFISGSDLIATSPLGKVDFTLLKIQQTIPEEYNVFYAGWDATGNTAKGSVCIHHPRGDVKKISIDTNNYTTSSFFSYLKFSHWKISRWEKGTTESGSSGSGLFNMNKQIIGNLSGGEADCDNPVNDYFSKFSVAWNYYSNANEQLQVWLDPTNTQKKTCTGYDPNLEYPSILSNIVSSDSLVLCNFGNEATGTWTGTNEIGWNQFADYISLTPHKKIYAFSVLGIIDTTQILSDVTFKVWQGLDKPELVVYSSPLQKTMISDSIWITIVPEEPIETQGSFWVGYEIEPQSTAFAAYMAKPRTIQNSMYVQHPKGWISTQEIHTNSSLAIQTFVTNVPDTIATITIEKPDFAEKISPIPYQYTPAELFAHDSIPCLFDSTQYFLATTNDKTYIWNGPNELGTICIANTYSKHDALYIRGLKLAAHDIPDETCNPSLMVWNSNFTEILAQKTIANTDLRPAHYNEIHFASPVAIEDTFSAGVCFDENAYNENLEILSLHNSFRNIDAAMYIPNMWYSLKQYNIDAHYAIQPITVLSQYHFNRDSLRVLSYPIQYIDTNTFSQSIAMTVFPNPCTDNITIQFKETLLPTIVVTLYNAMGYEVSNTIIPLENGVYTISVEELPKGIYILKTTVDSKVLSTKFIKK